MGEMCDFEARFFPGNWATRQHQKRKATPKQRVVARYPKAYSVKYENMAFVYSKPAAAAPRGQMTAALAIGIAPSVRGAWLDAAARLPPREKAPNNDGRPDTSAPVT